MRQLVGTDSTGLSRVYEITSYGGNLLFDQHHFVGRYNGNEIGLAHFHHGCYSAQFSLVKESLRLALAAPLLTNQPSLIIFLQTRWQSAPKIDVTTEENVSILLILFFICFFHVVREIVMIEILRFL